MIRFIPAYGEDEDKPSMILIDTVVELSSLTEVERWWLYNCAKNDLPQHMSPAAREYATKRIAEMLGI